MSRLNEYNPEFGVVFETEAEKKAREWLESLGGGTTTTTSGNKPPSTTQPTQSFNQAALQDKKDTYANTPGYFTREQLAAMNGARQTNANTIILGDGSKYTLDAGTGYYKAFGTASAADRTQYNAASPLGSPTQQTSQTATQPPASSLTPEARPFAGQGGNFTNLTAGAGPVIPGFDAYRQPGIGIPAEGRQTIRGVENGLNTMQAGRLGSATQFPVSPGYRLPGQNGNQIDFAGRQQTLEPQMLFGETSVSAPGTYVYGQGNVNDSNRAYTLPTNIGAGGAGLLSVGGNNVQMQGAPGSGVGYGYVLNAAPASNVFALTGRNASEDPASQAAQILMLNSAIAQGRMGDLMATNPNQFSGYRAGTGNGFFSGNGGMGQGTFWSGYSPDPAGAPPPAPPPATSPGTTPPVATSINPSTPGYSPNLGGSTNVVPNYAPGAFGPAGAGAVTSPMGPAFGNDAQALAALIALQEEKEMGGGDGFVRGYAGGGRVGPGPLGKVDQVIPEPAITIGMITGKPYYTMSEVGPEPVRELNDGTLRISPAVRGYATGGTVASATTLPPLPTMPALTQSPVLDSGPEVQSALRAANIQRQVASQDSLRARAGLSGATQIRTNANLQGLPPGYYTTPADYSDQIAGLQTQLAGLGPISSDPNGLLAYRNQLQTMLDPLKQAQDIQTQIAGFGDLGDPTVLQGDINRLEQQIAPLTTAQQIQLRRLGLGQVGDINALNGQIVGFNQQLAPLQTIIEQNERLLGLGSAYDDASITNQSALINSTENQINQLKDATPWTDPSGYQVRTELENQLAAQRNQLSQMLQRNNAIQDAQNILGNLLSAKGLTLQQVIDATGGIITQREAAESALKRAMEAQDLDTQLLQYAPAGTDITALLGGLNTQLDTAKTGYANTQKAAQLRAQLANYVPEGTDVSARIGQITGGMNTAQNAYDATLKAQDLEGQIQAYRNNTDIEGIEQDAAPAPVIAQAVVSTPVLKQIAQVDPASANAIARLDYAMSNGAWTPATSELLVNLTNSLSGSKAKGTVQDLLQGLVSKMPSSAGVPPAIAAAAQMGNPAQLAAAAKFGAAA